MSNGGTGCEQVLQPYVIRIVKNPPQKLSFRARFDTHLYVHRTRVQYAVCARKGHPKMHTATRGLRRGGQSLDRGRVRPVTRP